MKKKIINLDDYRPKVQKAEEHIQQVDTEELREEGVCAKCKLDSLLYGPAEFEGMDSINVPVKCFKCGWTGYEVFQLEFCGIWEE